jgi:hypothetical protein
MSQRYSNRQTALFSMAVFEILVNNVLTTTTTLPETRQYTLAPPNYNNNDKSPSPTSSPLAPPVLILLRTNKFKLKPPDVSCALLGFVYGTIITRIVQKNIAQNWRHEKKHGVCFCKHKYSSLNATAYLDAR